MKIKVTEELLDKALTVFNRNSVILTGQGLSRQELRALEREGTVRKQQSRLKKSGAIHHAWRINPSFGRVDGDRIKVLKRG